MLTKNIIKFIRSLSNKRERYTQSLFIIEGEKIVLEALEIGVAIKSIYASPEWINKIESNRIEEASSKDMERCTSLSKSPGILAVLPFLEKPELDVNKGKYILLDRINDPGNLGTIIRIADWFGLDGIICSEGSVDVYNQKVVQSSMGSIFRMPVWYENLEAIMEKSSLSVIAADMNGEDFSSFKFPSSGLLLMGSESHGISDNLLNRVDQRITIPRIGKAESLNLSVATGIICQAFSKV